MNKISLIFLVYSVFMHFKEHKSTSTIFLIIYLRLLKYIPPTSYKTGKKLALLMQHSFLLFSKSIELNEMTKNYKFLEIIFCKSTPVKFIRYLKTITKRIYLLINPYVLECSYKLFSLGFFYHSLLCFKPFKHKLNYLNRFSENPSVTFRSCLNTLVLSATVFP